MRYLTVLCLVVFAFVLPRPVVAASDCEDNKKHLRKKFTATIAAGVIKWNAAPPRMKKALGLLAKKIKKDHGAKIKNKKSLYAILQSVKCRTSAKPKWDQGVSDRFPAKRKIEQDVTITIIIPNPLGDEPYVFKCGW